MNMTDMRSLFPVLRESTFLNSAAESPLNAKSREALADYLELVSNAPQNKQSPRPVVRTMLSDLFGGAAEDYALVTSTGVGVGIAAAGHSWNDGDNVVVPVDEHWNSTFPWLALKDKGVEVRLVQTDMDQRVLTEEIAAQVDDNTRVVATTAVRFTTGFRADLRALSEIAHDKDALLVVDGIQATGVVPLNVETEGIDVLACGGFKWLLGMPGTGFMYTSRTARERIRPILPGMFAAENNFRELHYHDDARRYETGSIAYSLFDAWTAGLGILKEVGIENIYARILILTDQIISGLQNKGIKIITPVAHVAERSAIVVFTLGSEEADEKLYEALLSHNIIVSLRAGSIRVSPNFFNTEDDIERFLSRL
jgi:cysteine desulfurase/selenocysteine lyase